jgi:hypothetical protein
MSSADLITELQSARPVAGDALRERVRVIARATQPQPRPAPLRLPWRRLSLVALPATAAVAIATAGAIGVVRSDDAVREAGPPVAEAQEDAARSSLESAAPKAGTSQTSPGSAIGVGPATTQALPPASTRPQRYAAELTLEVPGADELSRATQQALAIARSTGGYVVQTAFDTAGDGGTSSLVLRVPTAKVQDAIVRLSDLGTIVAQRVSIEDLGSQVDELGRQEAVLAGEIARLQRQLARDGLAAEERAALRARLLQARSELGQVRAAQAQTREEARYATVSLLLRTEEGAAVPATPSRIEKALDEAASILAWEGIAVLYAFVIAGPVLLLAAALWLASRTRRRRDDERLLASS